MKKTLILSALAGVAISMVTSVALAAGGGTPPPRQSWSWTASLEAITGRKRTRPAGLQRSLRGCHGLRLVAYRNLMQLGYSKNR